MAMPGNCLNMWPAFEPLSNEEKQNIRLAITFKSKMYGPHNVIYVTRDDDVYAFGPNCRGCLGTGDLVPRQTPVKIEALCGQNVTDLVNGGKPQDASLYAITCFGSVFAWGKNEFGELGIGTKNYTTVPNKIKGELEHKRVVQIASGLFHTLALTSEGQVYSFGANCMGQLGVGSSDTKKLVPTRIEHLVGNFVTAVACGRQISVALLNTGGVFTWGTGWWNASLIPQKLNGLDGVPIAKVACGPAQAFALTRDGLLYAWGVIRYGQFSTNPALEPGKALFIPTDKGRITDITTSPVHYYPCIAVNEEGQAFDCGYPLLPFSCVDDVIFKRVQEPVTIKPLKPQIKRVESLSTCFGQLFDDQETSDFTFIVEGKKIFVHKLILVMRCPVFRIIFKGDFYASELSEHNVEGCSYETFHAFLKYIYTGEIEVTRHSALTLFDLARFHLMADLERKCVESMKSSMTINSVASYYDKSLHHNIKDLTDYAYEFSVAHRDAIDKNHVFVNASRSVMRDIINRGAPV